MENLTLCLWIWLIGALITFLIVIVAIKNEDTRTEDKLIMSILLGIFWWLYWPFVGVLFVLICSIFFSGPRRPRIGGLN